MIKDDYFIRIKDPKNVRRSILGNAKEVLQILQGYEDFKKIREQRSILINKFRAQTSEIKMIVDETRKMLPKANVNAKKVVVSKIELAAKPGKELRKIEEELADIESKLSEL